MLTYLKKSKFSVGRFSCNTGFSFLTVKAVPIDFSPKVTLDLSLRCSQRSFASGPPFNPFRHTKPDEGTSFDDKRKNNGEPERQNQWNPSGKYQEDGSYKWTPKEFHKENVIYDRGSNREVDEDGESYITKYSSFDISKDLDDSANPINHQMDIEKIIEPDDFIEMPKGGYDGYHEAGFVDPAALYGRDEDEEEEEVDEDEMPPEGEGEDDEHSSAAITGNINVGEPGAGNVEVEQDRRSLADIQNFLGDTFDRDIPSEAEIDKEILDNIENPEYKVMEEVPINDENQHVLQNFEADVKKWEEDEYGYRRPVKLKYRNIHKDDHMFERLDGWKYLTAPVVTKEDIEKLQNDPYEYDTFALIDVRPFHVAQDFKIPGSINIPLHDIFEHCFDLSDDAFQRRYKCPKPDAMLNLIFFGQRSEDAELACWYLNTDGYYFGYVYRGGVQDWFGASFKQKWMFDPERTMAIKMGFIEAITQDDQEMLPPDEFDYADTLEEDTSVVSLANRFSKASDGGDDHAPLDMTADEVDLAAMSLTPEDMEEHPEVLEGLQPDDEDEEDTAEI